MFLLNTGRVWVNMIQFQNRGREKKGGVKVRTSAAASDENMFGPAPHP